MTFIFGEGYLQRLPYRGTIGIFYNTIWGMLLSYIVFGLICIFTVIGVISFIKWLLFKAPIRKKK